MAFSRWLLGLDTVDTNMGASAGNADVLGHVQAFGIILLFPVAAAADGADDH